MHRFLKESDSEGARVLNVGSGGKVASELAKWRFAELLSIDIAPERNPDIVGDVCDMRPFFADDSFDIVVAMEVLEHVPTPLKAIDEVKRILKPGGIFIMSTPFIFPLHDEPHDYYRYTGHGLRFLLQDFEGVIVHARNDSIHAGLVLMLRLMQSPIKRTRAIGYLIAPFLLVAYPVIWIISYLGDANQATTGYLAVGKKPVCENN